ncbi:MAG TPA: hypothetical protein VKR82_15915 [Candidatus Acidoferrales bacterium]|nr:hypothetical protein [Candidatus Acidoferrales bacterium]
MYASYLNSLLEAFSRRMGLVLIGFALMWAVVFNLLVHFIPLKDGSSMVYLAQRMMGPGSLAQPALLGIGAEITGGLFWMLLSILAAAPLLSSTLDRGWLELTLSKGTARWRVFLGRYLGGCTLYLASVVIACMPLEVRFWWKTGIGPWPLLVAMLIQTFIFASLLSLAALAAVPQMGPAPPILLSLMVAILSPVLAARKIGLYQILTSNWSRELIDWMYRILPKTQELQGASTIFIRDRAIQSWYPFWSTGIFMAVMIALALWLLHRKSL